MNAQPYTMMKYAAIIALLALVPLAQASFAQEVPSWIKTSAGWWADDTISDDEFVQGISYLIKQGVLSVPATSVSETQSSGIPDWIKTSAGWWADGTTSDAEFLGAIQYLIKNGIIAIDTSQSVPETDAATSVTSEGTDAKLQALQSELEECEDLTKAYKRSDCRKAADAKIEAYQYKNNAQAYQVGPVTFYYPGLGTEGNEFFMEGEQPILTVRMLAENSASSENVALSCTGPAICSYDVWDGSKAFKYSGMDFTNGQIILKPGDTRVFNMLFGPNIGYGGTQFEYDSSKDYVFRISESWGTAQIPLDIE